MSLYLNIWYSADAVGPTPWKLYGPKKEPVNYADFIIPLAVTLLNLAFSCTNISP